VPELIVRGMLQCDSKVFFPDDPAQAPQFSDCPRQAKTVRRTIHSIVRLCARCAEVWDEQERQVSGTDAALVTAPFSNDPVANMEVPGITRISEAGHKALYRSGCIKG